MIPARHRMDSIDAAWLRMDRRTNPMIINGVWVLEGRITLEQLKQLITERWLIHERFRSVPVEEAIGGVWVEDQLSSRMSPSLPPCATRPPPSSTGDVEPRSASLVLSCAVLVGV